MIGLDTNVLVRYLTRDDAEQYRRAKAFLESTCTETEPGFINIIVLSEVVWVLRRTYDASRNDIVRIIEQLLLTRQLAIQHRGAVATALEAYRNGSADFADCLLGAVNREAGCTATATFDRAAGAMKAFDLL